MANKEFAKVFQILNDKFYASGIAPLTKLSTLNKVVRFNPSFPVQPNGTANTNPVYIIQKMLRPKSKVSPSKVSNSISADYAAILDSADKVEWETITAKPSNERVIGTDVPINSDYDIDLSNSASQKVIAGQLKNTLITLETAATQEVFTAGATLGILAPDGTTATADKIVSQISDAILDVELYSDKFKYMTDQVVVFIHPKLFKDIAKLDGVVWNKTGDKFSVDKMSFVYQGTTFYKANILNVVDAKESDKTKATSAGVIIMDVNAYASLGTTSGNIPFDEKKIKRRAVGTLYNQLSVVTSPDWIKTFDVLTKITKSADVNA